MGLVKTCALTACFAHNRIYYIAKDYFNSLLALVEINLEDKTETVISKFKGVNSFLLNIFGSKFFIGIDNKLVMSDDLSTWKTVIETKMENFFWHMTTSDDAFYIQDYGLPPSKIYFAKNGVDWSTLILAQDIDKQAKHFHGIIYDIYRKMLIATLGDGNLVRIAISRGNLGRTWRPLYEGTWQAVPIVILKDRVVFGLDSGVSKGGVLIWHPKQNKWTINHSKWVDKKIRASMCDLKQLSNGLWVAALGTPQAIIASTNLKTWHSIYIEGFDESFFNFNMSISEGQDSVAFTTGNKLLLFRKDALKEIISASPPVMKTYWSTTETMVNIGHVIKKKAEKQVETLLSR